LCTNIDPIAPPNFLSSMNHDHVVGVESKNLKLLFNVMVGLGIF
jgi:hypothetical protein